MKNFVWNEEKNEKLKRERNISFEIIILQIEAGKILDILEHPNSEKYQGQKIFVIKFNEYAFLVPFVEDE
ncbi:MAG TPA: toxin, partial [Candidatus Atribacteria bacterium]|nr:toxin [Candidatus Atribacteria bacterium]